MRPAGQPWISPHRLLSEPGIKGRSHRPGGSGRIGVRLLVVLLVIVLAVTWLVLFFGSRDHFEAVKVTDKERVCDQRDCKYLVFTDQGTFKITDSWLYLRFDSSDVYGSVRRGHVYDLDTIGWRIPLISTYRNVLGVHEVPPQPNPQVTVEETP